MIHIADGGTMMHLADLCEIIMADDRIKQALETVIGGFLKLELNFNQGKGTGAASAARALPEDWDEAFEEEELHKLIAWGLILGVGFAQLVWMEHEGRQVPRVVFYHPRWARWDHNLQKWFLRTSESEIEIEPGDGKWVVYTPYGKGRPWAEGKWRGIAEWWLVKDFARMDFARAGEGASTRVATADLDKGAAFEVAEAGGADKGQRRALAEQIDSAGADGTVVLPPGYDLKILQAAASTWSIYSAQIKLANMAFEISIKGQNLTTEIDSGGSRAAAEVHERVEDRVIINLLKRTQDVIRRQILVWWAEFNFGNRRAAPYIEFKAENEDLTKKAQRFDKVAGAVKKLWQGGHKVDPAWVKEEFHVEIQRDPEAISIQSDPNSDAEDEDDTDVRPDDS
jgi:phage gp29-like protein